MNELEAVVRELGPEERRVLLVLARRLLAGQHAYGRLDVARDGRDWRRERADELADALVYGAIAEVAATLPAVSTPAAPSDDDEPSRGDVVIVENAHDDTPCLESERLAHLGADRVASEGEG
jgi:hypothetical protein